MQVLLAALRPHCRAAKLGGVRCLIVDDSASFLRSASLLLESQGVTVVGCASSRAEALELMGALEVDVVLIDIQLGEEDGVALAREPAVRAAAACIVLISSHDVDDVEELIAGSGAAGFLPKTALGAAALDALVR